MWFIFFNFLQVVRQPPSEVSMKLTKLEEQGMRLAMCLARKGGQMTLPQLADKEGLSEALVAKVLGKLRTGGVVNALRGRNGGYELSGASDDLAVSAVLRALGRPLIDGCFSGNYGNRTEPCPHTRDCGIRPVWELLEEQVARVLDQVTLSDLVRKEAHVRDHLASIETLADAETPRSVPRSACCFDDN
jgi:Rrf2 family nitric oxide-sensitive transcriptional repressor